MTDYFNIESLLSDEEKILKETVHDWATNTVLPRVTDIWTNGTYLRAEHEFLREEVANLGLFGLVQNGGSEVMYGLVCQEVEACDSGLRSFISVQNSLVYYLLHEFASKDQKDYYLPKLVDGTLTGCYGLTEPDFGSNPGAMRSRARKTKNGWKVSGSKNFITNGVFADFAIIWAKRKDDEVVQAFIIDEANIDKVDRGEIGYKMSLRYSDTAYLRFDDVPCEPIPDSEGLKAALKCLTSARYGISWGVIGAARSCYEIALDYAKNRIQWDGKPLIQHQLVRKRLSDMLAKITYMQCATLQLGREKDKGKATFDQISMAKGINTTWALDIARDARDMLGAYGVCADYHIIRHMNNLESVVTYEGTKDIHSIIVGNKITGWDSMV